VRTNNLWITDAFRNWDCCSPFCCWICTENSFPLAVDHISGNASAAADKFHAQFNAGQYHEVFSESDDAFQKAIGSEANAIGLFEALRRKLGVIRRQNRLVGMWIPIPQAL
jgi:hypothetical protein